MQIIVDADSRRLSLGPTPPVRGETIPGTLTFMKGGVPFRLPAGTAIQIGLKSWNDPSDVVLAYTTATRPEPDGAPYTFSLSLNTVQMLAKFTAGVTRYDCSIEVKWEVSAGSGTFKKTQRRKYSVDADTLRDTDANPSTMLSRNDFLVTNGTGLLVNVAAGYAANGAFVAAQASLAITNATNYIEVTAAGVASVNTTAFTAGSYPLATVVASAGAITANTDLRAWITPKPVPGGVTDGDKGDITVSNSGATWTIDNDTITLAKLAHMPTARVVGRTTAGTGTPELLTISGTGSVAMTNSPSFTTPALDTPSTLVGTNISGTASGLTAGLVTSIGDLTGDVTSSNRATTLATVNSNVGAFTNASLTVNAKGLVTAASSGTSAVTSITGTANEITVTGTTTPTLSLPSALTFTGKTVTGGTFTGGTIVLPQVGYLAATFDYFEEWMTFISSTDAATWKRTHTTPIVTTEGTIRDPALHYVAATGTFYVAYTRNGFTGGNSWGLGSSTDGRTWTWSTISTGSLATGTPAHVWIGDWFTDSDGTDHVLLAANTTASQAAGGLYLYETHPTTPGDYSAWSTPVQITGSAITNNLGNSPAVVKVGSTYHLFYDLPSAGGIRHVTSSSLTSGYDTAGTYPAFPSATEGPAIITLANGTYRLYAEQNYQQSTAGLKYSDSTDLVTWGSVQSAVTQGYMGHPHGIQVTSQELLNKVSMLEQGQKDPFWSALRAGELAGVFGYPDPATEAQIYPGFGIYGGAAGSSFLNFQTRGANGAAIFTDPNWNSPASNNFYIARRSGLNYMRFDGGSNNVSFYGTATFFGSTSGSATISVSATGGLLALPTGTTATNMTLTTPDLGTPSAIVLTNASGTVGSGLTIPLGTVTLTGSLPDARNTVSNTTTTSMANLATVGTLTGGATGAGFTVALSTSTITGTLADARLSANVPLKDAANTFTNTQSMTSPAITTSITTPSTTFAIANATATTLNIGGAATTIAMGAAGAGTMNIPLTTSASSATTGALTIGNGTAATNVGIGGGNINAGGTIVAGGNISSQYITLASGRITINSGASTTTRLTNGSTNGWIIVDNQSGVGGAVLLGSGSGNPGIFRSGTTLQVRLADNSADAPISASNGTLSGTLSVTGATTLGTAGSAVGTIGFKNATSGTTTLSPATGALGTGTVTLPLSGTLATLAGTETLTNKRLTQRTGTDTSSATPTINTDNVDFYSLTAQAADITSFTTNLSGTPTDGQQLWIAITGTAARAITWGATFEAGAVALPTTTVTTTRLDVAFIWNPVTSKWRCMASG